MATVALRKGENELVVEVESGLYHVMTSSSEGCGLRLNHRLTKSNWLRKAQSQFGWDWSPRFVNVGIPGNVSLEVASGIRCEGGVVLAALC